MRSLTRLLLAAIVLASGGSQTSAQHRIGPDYPEKPQPEFLRRIPQSGYDPFHWNRYTQRWDYVPIPYDPEPPGANYNPFRFNWYSGRWDYVPYPLQRDYDALPRDTEGSNFFDTRIDPQQLPARSIPAPQQAAQAAPPVGTRILPPPVNPHLPRTPATTAPATRPAAPSDEADKRQQELARLRSLGRWDYDYAKGRWIFVLPSDR